MVSKSPPTQTKPTKPAIDWEGVEMQYRAGLRSLKDIGGQYGVSDAGILKRAKRDGWVRDLTAKIQAKAEAKVSAAAVSAEVRAGKALTEAVVIEANAEAILNVRLAHRTDIGEYRALAKSLWAELKVHTQHGDLFEELEALLHAVDEDSDSDASKKRRRKQLDAFQLAMSHSGRVKTMKDLADTLKTLVGLEREAWGVTNDVGAPTSYEQTLKDLNES